MIRKAIMTDMPAVLCIFEAARVYMRETGNPTQWGMNNPSQETLEAVWWHMMISALGGLGRWELK